MRGLRSGVLGLLGMLIPFSAASAGEPTGIGILGDSYSDEYQFYGPDRSTSRNWAEILSAMRGLDFGRFTDTSRGEPRNQGFAFNWARSDATTAPTSCGLTHCSFSRQRSSRLKPASSSRSA